MFTEGSIGVGVIIKDRNSW